MSHANPFYHHIFPFYTTHKESRFFVKQCNAPIGCEDICVISFTFQNMFKTHLTPEIQNIASCTLLNFKKLATIDWAHIVLSKYSFLPF
jgi:hypothetical protein